MQVGGTCGTIYDYKEACVQLEIVHLNAQDWEWKHGRSIEIYLLNLQISHNT